MESVPALHAHCGAPVEHARIALAATKESSSFSGRATQGWARTWHCEGGVVAAAGGGATSAACRARHLGSRGGNTRRLARRTLQACDPGGPLCIERAAAAAPGAMPRSFEAHTELTHPWRDPGLTSLQSLPPPSGTVVAATWLCVLALIPHLHQAAEPPNWRGRGWGAFMDPREQQCATTGVRIGRGSCKKKQAPDRRGGAHQAHDQAAARHHSAWLRQRRVPHRRITRPRLLCVCCSPGTQR